MRGKWALTDEEKRQWVSVFRDVIIPQLKAGCYEENNFTEFNLNPQNVKDILCELGYEDTVFEQSGWEQDCWQHFYHKDAEYPPLTVYSCGMTFEVKIYITEEEGYIK